MQFLRANTQVIVTVGPFVDVTDGFTPQTDIALAGNEAELMKHGGTVVVDISAATWAAVANCRGYYSLTLTASHTDTEGLLIVVVQDDSDCLPVKQEFMVLSEAAWDSMFVAKDAGFMDVNIKTIGKADATETEADNLETALAAAAGAAGGLFIAGSNAATTLAALTVTNALTAGTMSVTGQLDAGSFVIDGALSVGTTTTLTGNVSCGAAFDVVGALTAGSVSIDAGFDIVGALSCNSVLVDTTTTLTGAVLLGAALDVTGTTTLAALTQVGAVSLGATTIASAAITGALSVGTTTTLTGAVSLGATLDVVGATTFATIATSGTVTLNALTVTNAFLVSGTTTLTLAADTITAASINTGAFTADAFAADALVAATFAASSLDGKGNWNTVVPDAAGVCSTHDAAAVVTALGTGSGLTALATAAICTELRLAELDSANLPTDVAAIGIVGTSVAYAPTAAARTIGSDQGGTFTNLSAHDDSLFSTGENVSTGMSVLITRATSVVGQIPTNVHLSGYYDGNPTHSQTVQLYNYSTTAWDQVGLMLDRSSAFDYVFPMTSDHQDGASGEMQLRIVHVAGTYNASHRLYLDWISFDKQVTNSETAVSIAAIRAATDQLQFTLGNVHADTIAIGGTTQTAGDVVADTAAILLDTDELQDAWEDGGRLDLILDATSTHDAAAVVNEWETQSQADPTGFHVNVLEVGGTTQTANDNGGDINAIKVIIDALTAAAATKLALSAGTIVTGTVSHDNTAASTTIFYCDDITEATADHYNGRIVIFTSGALQYQATDITDYALVSSEGKFTVTALTEAPADNCTFIIV